MLLIGPGWRVAIAALVASLMVALAVGCGGSSEAAPLKRSQFVKQADEVCAAAQEERAGQREEVAETDGSEEEVMQTLLDPVEKMTDELGDLGPPAGQEKEVEAIIAAYEAAISQLEEEPTGKDAASAFDKANRLAAEYGLSDCAI